MKKNEFESTDKPLVLIVSFDPVNGRSIWDYYDWDGTDFWLNSIKEDFPKLHTFMLRNNAATKSKIKSHQI